MEGRGVLFLGEEQRLRELRREEARLRAQERTDAVEWQLRALHRDIEAAQAEIDDVLASTRERTRRLDEMQGRKEQEPEEESG